MSRIRRHLGLAALLGLVAALFAAPLPAGGQGSTPPSFADVARAAATIRPSVVSVAVELGDEGKAIGSGVVLRPGIVVTNAHVVEGATRVTLVLHDGSTVDMPAGNVRYDRETDVAVLQAGGLKAPAPAWANSDLVRVGDLAVAMGNPSSLRLRGTVTVGVISGTGRSLELGIPLLQTDTPINPGNSGGPLVNLRGEVIGLNSLKMVGLGIEGLGFTIPANVVRDVAERLLVQGSIPRFWLGLAVAEAPEAAFGLPTTQGLRVIGVYENRPGLDQVKVGDVIYTVNNHLVTTRDKLAATLNAVSAGSTVQLKLRRGSQVVDVSLPWADRPATEPDLRWENGIWRRLTPEQTEVATDIGIYLRDMPFDTAFGLAWLPQYIQADGSGAKVFLQTELIFVLSQIHDRARTAGEITPDMAGILAGVVRGKLIVTGVGPPGTYAVALRQGSRTWTSEPGPAWPGPVFPPARSASDAESVFHLQFDSEGIDPMGSVTLDLRRNGQPMTSLTWNLAGMY